MAKVYDIALNKETGDLLIQAGDFAISESTEQHMKDLIASNKTNYKASPLLGVALSDFLLDDVAYSDDLKKEIMVQFETDGIDIEQMNIASAESIAVSGEYTNNK